MSQGFPDFDPPRAILDRLTEVANEDFHQYSITWGAQNFREALAAKQSRFMGHSIDPDREVVVTLRQYRGHDVRHDDCDQPQ